MPPQVIRSSQIRFLHPVKMTGADSASAHLNAGLSTGWSSGNFEWKQIWWRSCRQYDHSSRLISETNGYIRH
ncbi:MAG: hypothetical protein DWQ34_03130 [Planctomycetota bacterium]|nr:MAG: hypothetical protein DWQ34_03130 [Planctomycetota bacterium]REK28336.1 MAG: hypothetical protein DWQ41_06060 [Planctomycetota bacterium]REK38812.1 MAG: hypothetical protein DWQ45_02905 [Planctomycetota bacterium]